MVLIRTANCSFLENGPRCQELVCKVDGFQSVLSLDKGVFSTETTDGHLQRTLFPMTQHQLLLSILIFFYEVLGSTLSLGKIWLPDLD